MADTKQSIAARWAQILDSQAGAAFAAQATAAAPGGAQGIFCQDWQQAKSVLQALQPILPQPGPIIVGLVIAAGDAAYQNVCQ